MGQIGLEPIPAEQAMEAFFQLLEGRAPHVAAMRVDWGRLAASLPPAPFWAVLEAQAEEDANMESMMFELATSLPTFVLNDGAKKRAKKDPPLAMKVIVPAMSNIKPLQRGEVLVFRGSLALADDEEEL